VSGPRWRPYLLLLAFAAAALAPLPWLIPAVALTGVAAMAFRGGRMLQGRLGRRAEPNTLVLGTDRRGREVRISEHELSAHGLILGASGTGKTTTLLSIVEQLIARGRPMVLIDMKGSPSFAHSVAATAGASGRPFRLWSPDGPGYWNPLQHGNATELKDKVMATERFTEPHYQRAAERFVQTVLQVIQARDSGPPTLAGVVELMDPHRLRGALRGLPPSLRDRVQDYLAGLTPDQLSAVRGLQTRLAILTESHTGRFLEPASGPSIDLRSALSGPEVVLFSLNSSTYGKLAGQLGTLVVQDLVSAAGDRLHAPARGQAVQQGFIVIDEASALGGDHILPLFARCREAGLGVLTVTQELTDFDRAAPGLRDQILGNTAIKLAHRQDVPSSAQTIAQLAGTEKVWEQTERIGRPLTGGLPAAGGTRRQTEQFIVHPNEIKTLRTGEAVLISKLRSGRPGTMMVRPPDRRDARASGRPGSERGAGRSEPGARGPERGPSGPELG
jgi:conjugal transfer pilus assembly protein TraD